MTEYLWTEKYRPKDLSTYVGNSDIKIIVEKFLETGDIPHLLFSGPPGTGKTTLAKIIVNSIECDVLYINASDENNVETVRNKIKDFASGSGFNDLKVLILDEADFLSQSAQAALRNLMEAFSHSTRFILTCNYVERILPAIFSRTQSFAVIPPSPRDIAKHVAGILDEESVKYELLDIKTIIDVHYPDIRKIIQECQLYSGNGTLNINKQKLIDSDFNLKVIEMLSSNEDDKKKFQSIRQIFADSDIKDFSNTYRILYDRVTDYADSGVSGAILAIAEGQYRDALVVDKEINMMATIINILNNS